MSAIKKNTAKSKSPAPASKDAKPAPVKKTAEKSAVKSEKATAAIVAAVTRVAAPVIAETSTARVKPVPAKRVATVIEAKIDVGFGNTLFLRGEGPGLSWDQGVAMVNVGSDVWQLELPESSRGYTFKFLINDQTWSTGADFTAASGVTTTFTPEF